MFALIQPPTIPELWEGLVHLFYPKLCVGCQRDLPAANSCFCLPCQLKLIPFSLESPQTNSFTERLWGRLPMEWGVAAYHFTRRSPIQKALHQLKYHNNPEVGIKIGRELARRMLAVPQLRGIDAIIPVPLHPRKERTRGYNQSAMFALGLSEGLDVPVLNQVLVRRAYTETQTRKKRMERFQNVGEVFEVVRPELLKGKHVLLVDDVLTTGATLELCGLNLLKAPDLKLSIATIAIADL